MNRKYPFAVFIAICLILCMIPSVFMIFFRSDEAIGNETQTKWPSISLEDGSFNSRVLEEMGSYFETHYAFRPQLITIDARLEAALFQVSNTDSVTVGKDGWLYYSSTLPDYLGKDPLSSRGMWNLAHNLALIQNYVTAMGARFLFTVPPNKNSLYPEHMPYYYDVHVSELHNRDHLQEYLGEAGVSYLDLFALFEGEEETLYLKQDSHWNNKGARMVCRRMMDLLEKEHEAYDAQEPVREAIHRGDLANMIFPADTSLEEDFDYRTDPAYSYIPLPISSDPVSVEDFRIETENPDAQGTLLMYRDSFGNTLIPVIADSFAHGYFAKATPYPVARDIQQYQPQYVIIELVERNIQNLAKSPAIIPAPRRDAEQLHLNLVNDSPVTIEQCAEDASYVAFSGAVTPGQVSEQGRIYIAVPTPDGKQVYYEAFTVSSKNEEGEWQDFGYRMYLPVSMFGSVETAKGLSVEVYTE